MTIDDQSVSPGIEMITGLPSWLGLTGDMRATIEAFVNMLCPRPDPGPVALTDREYARVRHLALLAAYRAVEQEARDGAVLAGRWAQHFGATPTDLAALDGTTPHEAAERYVIPERNRGDLLLPQRPGWTSDSDS
jgi:hypothetical protein